MAEEFKQTPNKEIPSPDQKEKRVKKRTPKEKTLPQVGNPENTVRIGETLVEIKPTKVKYHRNNTAYFYKIVETLPLPDILALPTGAFGDDRDGDKALMDWLTAEKGSCLCRDLTGMDLSAPGAQQAFRAPGGAHERVCEALVPEICRHLARLA